MSKRNLLAYAKGNNITGLSHSETVVVLLLKKFPDYIIPEKTVIEYYNKRVRRNQLKDSYGVWKPYTALEIRSMALQWFYRSIGKLISRQIIQVHPTIQL